MKPTRERSEPRSQTGSRMREQIPAPGRLQPTLWQRITHRFAPTVSFTNPEEICLSRWHTLDAAIQAYRPLRTDHVQLPGTDVTLRITRPYPVITSRTYDVPFWSVIWPSGVALAGVVAHDPGAVRGRRVLELGPGVGTTAIAALAAGADLVVADA